MPETSVDNCQIVLCVQDVRYGVSGLSVHKYVVLERKGLAVTSHGKATSLKTDNRSDIYHVAVGQN